VIVVVVLPQPHLTLKPVMVMVELVMVEPVMVELVMVELVMVELVMVVPASWSKQGTLLTVQ
jgi:hypothetical protein